MSICGIVENLDDEKYSNFRWEKNCGGRRMRCTTSQNLHTWDNKAPAAYSIKLHHYPR